MRRPAPSVSPILAASALAMLLLSACGPSSGSEPTSSSSAGKAISVTAGFYPYEFVAARVGGEDVQVTNLTSPGGEPHDLELTPQQVAALSRTDLVVYSRGFQPAVDEAVDQQAADRALDVLTTVELLEGDHDAHEGESKGADEPAHEDEGAGDPHVWLDPVRLATIAEAVAEQLAERAPERADGFRQRAAELGAELKTLDEELRSGLADCPRKEIVTSHDAFGYLAASYGLEQVSIAGLSPEDEASPKRLAEVATFAKQNNVTTIFFEELASPKVAQSLAREVGAEAQVLSPLEGPPDTGDYLSAMRTNLDSLRAALGCA
ncbi:MAG: metal ABC transporter substrate-binding protein [Mycobacteriales bacterium]